MRKVLLFIPAMLLAVTVNATPIPAGAGSLSSAIGSASANDIIELASGEFTESSAITLDKNLIIKAADGATPIVKSKGFGIQNGARVTFEGITFDASTLASGDYHLIYANSSDDNNRLILENCEIYGFDNNSSVINCNSAMNLDSLIVNDCYIHDIKKSFLFQQGNSLKGLTVKNSTFAHVTTVAGSYYANIIHPESNIVKVLIDHCTFYDCNGMASDYGSLKVPNSSDVVVSNCIFTQPEPYAGRALILNGTVTNCLLHNFTKGTKGIHTDSPWAPTIKECSDADPQFTDDEHDDFSYPGNYVTMSLSPARSAGTDATDLGDPRWYTAPTLPSTNFASAYELTSTKALLNGNIELNANSHIAYKGNEVPGTALWKFHVEKACAVTAIADFEDGNTSGCTLRLMAFNAAGELLDSIAAPYHDKAIDLNFSGCLYFPAAGDYTLKLYNGTGWSSAKIEKFTLSYAGGAVQNIPANIGVGEAWYGIGGTRTNDQITFSSWKTNDSWIKWNVKTADNLYCNVKVNISTTNAHSINVAVIKEGTTDTLKLGEAYTSTTGDLTLNLGKVYLIGGKNYIVKVTNPTSGSAAKINSIQFEEIDVTSVSIPTSTSLLPTTAMLSSNAGIVDGNIDFAAVSGSSRGNNANEWARWKISVTEDNAYIFTANVTSTDGQYYTLQVLSADESKVMGESVKTSDIGTGDQTQASNAIALYAGETYIVKIVNTYAWSHGRVKSISITQATEITIDEAEIDVETIIGANEGQVVNAQLIRSFMGGMYNTICLPFAVSAAELARVFPGAQVKALESSSVENEGFVLNLNFADVTELTAGTPYIIQPVSDVVNPLFIGVTIDKTLRPADTDYTEFIGNIVSGTIHASADNLFLSTNNSLYFPEADRTILGMRAYFRVHDISGGPHMIRTARIVTKSDVITEVELIESQEPTTKCQKLLINGQLLILHDGVRYNVMGIRVE